MMCSLPFRLVSRSVSSSFCAPVDLIFIFWNASFYNLGLPRCFLCELCNILASFFPLLFCEIFTLILTRCFYCFCLGICTSSSWTVNTGCIVICLILSNIPLLHPFSYMFLVLFSFRQHFLPLLTSSLLKSCVYVVAVSCPSLWSLLFRSFQVPHLKLHPF